MPVSVLRCVTTFDAMVDVDLGLVRLVLDEFNNPEFLIEGIENIKYDLKSLRILLADRELENPLSVILKPELEDQFDSLRDQFFDAYYEQILTLTGETSVTRLLGTASLTKSMVETTVFCKSELEVAHIRKLGIGANPLLMNDSLLPSERFNDFFLKRGSDVVLFEPIRGKNVTLMEYKFNFDQDESVFNDFIPKEEVLKEVAPYNSIYTIPVYPGIKLPQD